MCPKRDIVNLKQFPINQAPAVTSSSLSIKHRFDSASRVPIHKSTQLGMPKPDLRSKTEQILAPISQQLNATLDNISQLRTYDGFLASRIVDPSVGSCSMPKQERLKVL